jgi:hypothetical protein
VCVCVCAHACMYVYMYVCMYVCTYVCMYVCMHVRVYVGMYVFMYVCMYEGRYKIMPPIFFLRKYKYTHICNEFYAYYVDILYKFEVIFLQTLHYQHTLPLLRETQFSGRAEFLADALGLFTHAMLQRIMIH